MNEATERSLELLELSAVPDVSPPIYGIGLAANRITFADQQRRAINTIWALLSESRVTAGDHIAIIGAGVAGVTAANYAIMCGLQVSLFEQHGEPFAIQRGSSRWIHPNIYDWPSPIWRSSTTDLPCMNWRAGTAAEVIASLWPEWLALSKSAELKSFFSHSVTNFDVQNHKAIVITSDGIRHGPYACIVAAIGFGEEHAIAEIDSKPYWKDDDLHQRIRSGGTVIVSGCGDGGLVDVMRISLRDFRHELLADIADAASADHRTITHLHAIERNASSYPNGKALTDAIIAVDVPNTVTALLKGKLRQDTIVILNGRADGAFARTSCMLNRFIIAQLLKLGVVRYQPGAFSATAVTRTGSLYSCVIGGHLMSASEIVVRHGPTDRSLQRFSNIDKALVPVRTFLQRYSAGVDRTRTRAWGALKRPSSPGGVPTDTPALASEALDRLAIRIQETVHTILAAKGYTPVITHTRADRIISLVVEAKAKQNFTIEVSHNNTISFSTQKSGKKARVPVVFTADLGVFTAPDAELRRWVVEAIVGNLESGD